ncbi:MAG TPA: tRNA pseudouridine(38-40) synthase TruA [Candidatus Cybelea sp.]
MTVAYDGTDFRGFQWQPAGRTVAGVLEAALAQLFGESTRVTGAGRTDRGVHATGQVISFSTQKAFPFERLTVALNAVLPPDCSIRESALVGGDFSARFSARERTYTYVILNQPQRDALLARYAYRVTRSLDIPAMRAAAAHLVGEHDFRSFVRVLPEGATTRRVARLEVDRRDALARISITADSFLHRMVRTIVGTLIESGSGRRDPSAMPAILAARDRSAAGDTAPPHGLYLAGVRYADGYDSLAEPPVLQGWT